jgi:hypothetical protein
MAVVEQSLKTVLFAFLLILNVAFADAGPLSGTKQIWLANSQGERVEFGSVLFVPQADGSVRFAVTVSDKLGEYFLAMRPFRCLAGPRQHLCWFPYEVEPVVTEGDLTALEYALMFLQKKPAALHLNSADGLYFRLTTTPNGLVGTLYEVDMEPIVVPGEDRKRPIKPEMLHETDGSSHWLPRLVIE